MKTLAILVLVGCVHAQNLAKVSARNYNTLQSALAACGDYCELEIPAGTYYIGSPGLSVSRNNVSIKGAGIGRTVLFYNSSSCNGTVGPGSAILLGSDFTHQYSNITISDLSLIDLNVSVDCLWSGHNPSAIDAIHINNLTIERVECQDAKGNACITPTGGNGDSNLIIRDCYVHGTSAGGWIQFNGINYGNYTNLQISGNSISGAKATLLGGGGTSNDVHIFQNTLDGTAVPETGGQILGLGGGNRQVVEGNTLICNSGDNRCLGIGVDTNQDLQDIHVEGNVINAGPAIGITYAGTPGINGRLRISNNEIIASQPIQIGGSPGPADIGANIVTMSGNGPFIAGPFGPVAVMNIHDNQVTGTPWPMLIPDPAALPQWATPLLHLSNNFITAK